MSPESASELPPLTSVLLRTLELQQGFTEPVVPVPRCPTLMTFNNAGNMPLCVNTARSCSRACFKEQGRVLRPCDPRV